MLLKLTIVNFDIIEHIIPYYNSITNDVEKFL
jgi:hypothetical protein